MGVLIGILVFCGIAGNAFLITGAMSDDLADNPIAWIMVIIAIICDILVIGSLISNAASKREMKEKAEEERLMQERQRVARQLREEKDRRERKNADQLSTLISLYGLEDAFSQSFLSDSGTVINHRNPEACNCFKVYCEAVWLLNNKIKHLAEANQRILLCPGCSSTEEKIAYIHQHEDELKKNKEEATNYRVQKENFKIVITDFESEPLTRLRNAMSFLKHSKRIVSSSNLTIKDFLSVPSSNVLKCFQYSVAPVMLNFEKFHAYCFPKLILLCNQDKFLAAVNPSALSIEVIRKEVDAIYDMDQNTYLSAHIVAEDSLVINKGQERLTWQHACRDGSPDLRYSYNPAMRRRNDRVVYGKVRISINHEFVEYTFSSHRALEALQKAYEMYCKNNKAIGDPIPALIELLSDVNESMKDDYVNLKQIYQQNCKERQAVCVVRNISDQIS